MTSKREIIEAELEAIWNERHRLTPGDVVEVAQAADHPLHSFFEWDNGTAAHAFRLSQASGLIRSVKVSLTVERADAIESVQVRSWIAGRAAGIEQAPEGYVPERDLRDNPANQALVLRTMRREMLAAHRRYSHLAEYWQIVGELERPAVAEAG